MTLPSQLSRRTLLTGSAAMATLLLGGTAPSRALAATTDPCLSLPRPTGPHPVGTEQLHLVDPGGEDPLAPSPRRRELMVTLWYPARPIPGAGAPYLSPILSSLLTQQVNALIGTAYPDDLLTFPTHARRAAPLAPGRHPLVLFSPGRNTNTAFYTGLLEELASRGYVVAGIDHTFDILVEFPDGRIEPPRDDLADETLLAVRIADLALVRAALRDPPPSWLTGGLDHRRVAAAGHSLGSMTAIGALEQDPQLTAGVAMDGNPLGSASLRQPFLLLGNPGHRRVLDADWAAFYDRLRGPRLHLVVDGAEHHDLSDLTVFKEIVDLGEVFELGEIAGRRSLRIVRDYVTAWLDASLFGRGSALLRREPRRYPEVDFQR